MITSNQRVFGGNLGLLMAALCVLYTGFHIAVMNLYPLEPWLYRLIHVAGGLALGFVLFSAHGIPNAAPRPCANGPGRARLDGAGGGGAAGGWRGQLVTMWITGDLIATGDPAGKHLMTLGWPLIAGTVLALVASWTSPMRGRSALSWADTLLSVAAVIVAAYIILHADFLRMRAQVFPHPNDMWAADRRDRSDPGTDAPRLAGHGAGHHRGGVPRLWVSSAPGCPACCTTMAMPRRGSLPSSIPTTAFWGRPRRFLRPTSSCSSPLPHSCRHRGSASISSTLPLPRRADRAAARPRWRCSPRG